jgi:hypothetical protein
VAFPPACSLCNTMCADQEQLVLQASLQQRLIERKLTDAEIDQLSVGRSPCASFDPAQCTQQ